ncbi:alpha/beta fold hydrolase [Rhodococcus sp. D2-41]|uniref:Alpha/beta hydrolase n=1 Tax=Speluncibacter jeojiensis TaxID=2710754 RepID=A0A9X4M1S6_9ACTN|nr:alpha/beta fold hydrolase [Rhodococcus sp. D2-41]MDG3009083.1 alpha/beta fold hydrolase [Rhodococcus sp. D2-41]MDG3015596.1 alpha/beta hydrolase [Corynebacteriales bacterium D3-21]
MPITELNGIRLSYQVHGTGPLVVMVMGTGSPGRVWSVHQVPALVAAGYQVVTVDNRGIAPTDECAGGFTIDDMVRDVAALIEHLGGPARVVGTSMGSRITQELALARPDLVSKAVMLATYGRQSVFQERLGEGEKALIDEAVELPAKYRAAVTAILNLSPATLEDPASIRDWLDIFEFSGSAQTPGLRAQMNVDRGIDRIQAYRQISVPCLVVGFGDDRMTPTYLGREVAEAIPGARYEEIPDCGHYGYLERPEAVNKLLVDYLAD